MKTKLFSAHSGTGRLLAGAAIPAIAMALAGPAFAQDTEDDTETPVEVDNSADAATADQAIVVTGSRLRSTTPFNSPDPISIIDPEIARKEGRFDLADALQSSPIANGSTQITSAISSNFLTDGGPGAQTISLRGLGANRTLVLLNSRRAGPAGTRSGVSSFDLNVLPLSVIDDIQILKTGASSVYGSDAVAGVVNIITAKDTDGLKLDFNVSVPLDSGGEQYRASLAWGKDFGGGNFLIAADYAKTRELARGDRDYLACPEAYIFNQDGSRADLTDPRTGSFKCEDLRWGHIWTYNLLYDTDAQGNVTERGNLVLPNGVNTSLGGGSVLLQYEYPAGPYPYGGPLNLPNYAPPTGLFDFYAPEGFFPTGYDAASTAVQNGYHPFVEQQTIIPETDLYTIYAQGSLELSDDAELFGEFLFNRRETYQNGWRQFWNFGWTGDLYSTGAGNAYNYWADGFGGFNFLSPTAITDQSDSSQKVDYYRGVAGIRGEFGSSGNWGYEVYGQYSRNIGRYRTQQILQDVYDSGYFQYSSCVGDVLPVSGKDCIDLPWADPYFLAGQLTQEQIDFIFDWEEGKTIYEQITAEASVSGELLQLPAGPLGLAFGVTARRDEITDTPGEITLARNAWGASLAGITSGYSWTKEAFAETSIPILANKPFFEELTLTAAARITNVSADRNIIDQDDQDADGVPDVTDTDIRLSDDDNGNITYKLGLNWAVTDFLRFRASYGTSFRAPALFEQFRADEVGFISQRLDVCSAYEANFNAGNISQQVRDNCAADGIPPGYTRGSITIASASRGGLGDLQAETSDALVIGGILTPDIFPNTSISLAVDYFEIDVQDEIAQLGGAAIVAGCYASENFATEPLCDLFTRNRDPESSTAFQILEIIDPYINVASQKNTGIDVAFRAEQDMGSWGDLAFTADMTWQLKDDLRLLPTSPLTTDNGEPGSPSWVGDFRLTWSHPSDFSLFYGMNVIGGADEFEDFDRSFANRSPRCLNSFNNNDGIGEPIPIYGNYCPDLRVSPTFYHNISATKLIADGRFAVTAGVSNIFDTRPPRVSVLNGGFISTLGPVVAASQYGFTGRRVFLNFSADF